MTTTSRPLPGGSRSDRLKTSRINLLARFLRTASPSFLEATIPSLAIPASLGAASTVAYLPFARCEKSNTRWNSSRRLTRLAFVKRSDGMRFLAESGLRATGYEEETVRRLRPFARRRFSTCRPFLVAIRTRNPCVRLRRRRFGWNVTLIVGSPAAEEIERRNLDSNQSVQMLSIADDGCPLPKPCVTVASPAAPAVGSPPEVFHNCGKKCGKEPVFRRSGGTDATMRPFSPWAKAGTARILMG